MVDGIDGGLRNIPLQPFQEPPVKTRNQQKTKKTSFSKRLKESEDQLSLDSEIQDPGELEAKLETLLDEVQLAGQDLVKNPSPLNIKKYKNYIRNFISIIIKSSLDTESVEGRLRKDMKKPKYLLVKVIDEKLDRLGAYILNQQADKLEILRKIDELQGLLIDLKQ